jgi:hypothetical protein
MGRPGDGWEKWAVCQETWFVARALLADIMQVHVEPGSAAQRIVGWAKGPTCNSQGHRPWRCKSPNLASPNGQRREGFSCKHFRVSRTFRIFTVRNKCVDDIALLAKKPNQPQYTAALWLMKNPSRRWGLNAIFYPRTRG